MPEAKAVGLVNCTVLTMDRTGRTFSALAWEGERILLLGTREEVEGAVRARMGEVIDLRGATVLPGFCDAHVHLMATGLNTFALDLTFASTVIDILDLVREAVGKKDKGSWVFGRGIDEAKLAERRPPRREELDQAAPEHPVILFDRGMHYSVVNSRGWEKLNLPPNAPGLQLQNGRFTGRIQEVGKGRTRKAFYDSLGEGLRAEAVVRFSQMASQKGVTTVHAIDGGELFSDSDIPIIKRLQPALPLRVVLFWNTADVAKVRDAGHPRAGGCILLDGAIGSRTACFDEPYADDPSTTGKLNFSDEQVLDMMETAHRAVMQISFHTIGETAIRQALRCYRQVLGRSPVRHRHRLEHFGVPRQEDMAEAADLGIIISTQPAFAYLRGGPQGVYAARLGPDRERRAYPLKDLVRAGLVVAGGSDADVTPVDPLLGIHSCVNHPHREQRLDVGEALRLFTVNGAWSGGQEGEVGSLVPGKLADLAVLERNPLETGPDELKDIRVVGTVKGGRIVFSDVNWLPRKEGKR